jgi:ABC-type branched-subunit amino acid transport system permease subunit
VNHLAYLLLGLGAGGVIAVLALGVVMTQRAAGVVNFAHAAVGTYLAFAFYEFRETGDLVLPLVGVPHRIFLLPRPTVATALVVLAVVAAALGLVLHLLVFRPLRTAPALARLVASIGLFLWFWSVVGLNWTTTPAVRPVLPTDNVVVLGRLVGVDRLALAGLAVLVAAAVWALGRHTRFGLATTASAENDKGAVLSGLDPDRIAAANWMLATVLAGAAVTLGAQVIPLDALNNSLLIVPALAAALLGGFRSAPAVAAAGLGIGAVQSELLNLRSDLTWLPDVGWQQGLPFLIILVVLAVRGRALPGRGEPAGVRYPAAPPPRHLGPVTAVLVVGAAGVLVLAAPEWRAALITTSILAVLALSVVVVTGFVGQISLASYAFAGVAAFAMVRLTDAGVPFPVAPLLGAALAGALGWVVGLPAVRVRGMGLAIVTLGAAVAISELLFRWDAFVGSVAGTDVPEPTLGPVDLTIRAPGDAYPRAAFGLLCVAVLAVAAVAVANLRRSGTGLRWLAVRSNERAAAAAGVDVARAKLAAFSTSAVLAGLGGCLLAYQRLTITADSFGVFNSLSLLALTYLAGIAVVPGALTAGVLAPLGLLAVALGQDAGQPSSYQFAVSGLLLVVVAVLSPDGLCGMARSAADRLRGRRAGAALSDPPPAASPAA